MIIFIQSYASPSIMSADFGVYNNLKEFYKYNLIPLSVYSNNVRALSLFETFKLAILAIKKASKEDVIFVWGGDIALLCWYLSIILRKKARILGQNLIINPDSFVYDRKQKIRGWLYKNALKDKNFKMTVNADPLRSIYAEALNCSPEKFSLVHDSMMLTEFESELTLQHVTEPYIFCGGKEQRDIDCFLRVVDLLPHLNFKAIFKKKMIPIDFSNRKNLQLYIDLDSDRFYDILSKAKVCFIPLKAKTPCGLFVIQKAMLMNIPIVSTETPSMRTIIPDDSYGHLHQMGDDKAIIASIEGFMNDNALCTEISIKAKKYIENVFSPDKISKELNDSIEDFISKTLV